MTFFSGNNPTAIPVAQAPMTNTSQTLFGLTFVVDDPLTIGPNITSKIVGRAQGIYASADQNDFALSMVLNFVFFEGKYNGSSFSLLTRNPILSTAPREFSIVGGSGLFRFARAESALKPMEMEMSGSEDVVEVIHDARNCYIDGSTDAYNDEEFNWMMLRDGCFILFFIECISCGNDKVLLNNEYLGALGFANVARDIFVLENQIPFVVLEVLLELRFADSGEEILNGFFNYLNYGEVIIRQNEKVLENKQPLHLLELYRSYFISLSASLGLGSINLSKWRGWAKKMNTVHEDYNYIRRNRSFSSVMELKAKGIFLKCAYDESSNEDIKFHSHCCYGELELVRRAVSSNTKAIYLNMIAYEMCPHNPNDFRVSTYIRVMKSLVIQRDDVKELRNSKILLHSLGRDEEVVKMYDEIDAPAVNLYMFNQLRRGIEKHCTSQYKTWAAELITVYFSSPWKTVALLVASAILITSFLQTYFAIRPLPDESNGDIMKLLRRCAHFKHPSTPP
ncbi:hypothetical protein CTI12_AA121520 [Artemisia annua]|uniref:Uncharacterized protein n=1 Tax=Artemisia annua TaxID=35608 RepID=A0A2U1PRJ6_ARTAN|nr:hypothetical protein CTI12_AA121520 [Artemisia annua]